MPLTTFRLDFPDLADPHMRGPIVQTLLGSVGAQLDATAEQIMWARLQGNPFAGGANATREGAARLADGRLIECEPFVLPIHAEMRGVPLYPTLPVLGQRINVSRWWQLHAQRGTHWGELDHLRPYFATATAYPTVFIVFQSNEPTPAAYWTSLAASGTRTLTRRSPSNYAHDGQTAKRTRWWAFLEMPGTGLEQGFAWDDGHAWDDGWAWDTDDITSAMAADIVAMLRDWKGDHSWLAGVALVWTGDVLGPMTVPTVDGAGHWSLPGGVGAGSWANVAARPLYVSFIYDNPG